jgi:hypothetical protein
MYIMTRPQPRNVAIAASTSVTPLASLYVRPTFGPHPVRSCAQAWRTSLEGVTVLWSLLL